MRLFVPTRIILLISALATASTATAIEDSSKNYTFKFIADTSAASCFTLLTQPSINNLGQVAFAASVRTDEADVPGIFVSNGTQTRQIFIHSVADMNVPGYGLPGTSINDEAYVAFRGVSEGSAGVFTSDGRRLTRVYSGVSSAPIINSRQQVAFVGYDMENAERSAVYMGNGGPLTRIGEGDKPYVNDIGTVVFYKGDSIRMWKNGAITTIAPVGEPDFASPAINNSEQALYVYLTWNPFISSLRSVQGDGMAEIATPQTSPFKFMATRSISNRGEVAFWAAHDDGEKYGIYTGPDAVENKVIETGDSLFGSIVTMLEQLNGGKAINEKGQIAFLASLADGRAVIAVASPRPSRAGQGQNRAVSQNEEGAVFKIPF